jgi:hypothetical protein
MAGESSTLARAKVKDELLGEHDLSKKDSRKRQLEYAERTARRAVEQLG